MLLSVIIPTCHRNDLLAKCLDCLTPGLQSLTADKFEVIVTDDGVKSTARELVRNQYPWARCVEGPRKGPAANRNNGAKHADGEWLVFTDDDCLPDSEFLAAYWNAAMKNESAVLEGRTSPTGIRTRVDMDCPSNETGGFLWSCNMAIQKDLFFELGGFDTNFPGPAMEDVDLNTRLLKEGKQIKFVPSALVFHPWRLKRGIAFWKLHSESRVYFAAKHPEKAKEISLTSLAVELGRKLIRQLPPVVLQCRGRGLGRELLITCYITYSLIISSKRGIISEPRQSNDYKPSDSSVKRDNIQ
jgi:GT2 family glycosyltransferase